MDYEEFKNMSYTRLPLRIFWKEWTAYNSDSYTDKFKVIYNQQGREEFYCEAKYARSLGYGD